MADPDFERRVEFERQQAAARQTRQAGAHRKPQMEVLSGHRLIGIAHDLAEEASTKRTPDLRLHEMSRTKRLRDIIRDRSLTEAFASGWMVLDGEKPWTASKAELYSDGHDGIALTTEGEVYGFTADRLHTPYLERHAHCAHVLATYAIVSSTGFYGRGPDAALVLENHLAKFAATLRS